MTTSSVDSDDRLITLAIHTYEYASSLKNLLENEGIEVELHNVNLANPTVSAGIRVRIHEHDLPLALRIVENREIFNPISDSDSLKSGSIVVPTDFSDHSLEATLLAFRLAHLHKTDIVLLHAYIDPTINSEIQLSDAYSFNQAEELQVSQRVLLDEKDAMNNFVEKIKSKIKSAEIPPVKFTSVITEGIPEEVIVQYARSNNPYLLVMGTREAVRKEKDLIGSVTAEVLDSCRTTSTITIPSNCNSIDFFNPHAITFFCNLDQRDILALDTLCRMFPNTDASVTLIYLPSNRDRMRDTDKALATLTDYCRINYPQFTFKSMKTGPSAVTDLLSRNPMDLIVVANKKKNVLARLFNPGIAHRLLFRTDVPMMTIPV